MLDMTEKTATISHSTTLQTSPYPTAAMLSTQQVPQNVRVYLPTVGETEGIWPVALTDLDAGNVLYVQPRQAWVICAISELFIPLFQDAYPDIHFVTHNEVHVHKLTAKVCVTYCLRLFFDDAACNWQPSDFRFGGERKAAAYILGVTPKEEPAKISFPGEGRPIAEDQTSNYPLTECVRWPKHATFFIGLSSDVFWLAWSAGTPVVMISGFTHLINEFETPFRIINWHACNSCWNDPKERFDHHDFLWCPRHANTPRQFECTRLITAQKVILSSKNNYL